PRADGAGILAQQRRRRLVALAAERGDEVEPGARFLQQRDDRLPVLLGGRGERRAAGRVGRVHVGAERDQEPRRVRRVLGGGVVQRRAVVLVAAHACRQQRRIA